MAENIIASPDDSPKEPKSMRLAKDLADTYINALDARMNGVQVLCKTGLPHNA